MKASYILVPLLLGTLLYLSCSKTNDTASSSNNPSGNNPNNSSSSFYGNTAVATAPSDNAGTGIYKGVVTGSTGYYTICIKNGDERVFAVLNFDNVYDSLLCTTLNSYVKGSADIINAVFVSALGKQDSLFFSVKNDGSSPTIKISIPGHNASASIIKEISTTVVKLYQGTISDTLVAGYFYWPPCTPGNSTVPASPTAIRIYAFNIAIKGSAGIVLGSNTSTYKGQTYAGCDSHLDLIPISINANNQIIMSFKDCNNNKTLSATVTDASISGDAITQPPITVSSTGSCIDAYNSHIQATRVK
jgi:hypothetical protein